MSYECRAVAGCNLGSVQVAVGDASDACSAAGRPPARHGSRDAAMTATVVFALTFCQNLYDIRRHDTPLGAFDAWTMRMESIELGPHNMTVVLGSDVVKVSTVIPHLSILMLRNATVYFFF